MGKILREELYRIIEMSAKDSTHYLIAKEILKLLNSESSLNTSIIAENTFTSRPTVIRFAQSFGFNGFKEFAIELKKQDAIYNFDFQVKSFETSFEDYELLIKNRISDFANYKEVFLDIAKEIKTRKKLFIFSSYENLVLVKNFADKISVLGIEVFCVFNQQILLLNMIQNGDLLLFVVSGLDNKTLRTLWDHLNLSNVTVLIGTPFQQLTLMEPDYAININVVDNDILREQLKPFLFNYVLDQIYNLLIYSDKTFFELYSQKSFWRIV